MLADDPALAGIWNAIFDQRIRASLTFLDQGMRRWFFTACTIGRQFAYVTSSFPKYFKEENFVIKLQRFMQDFDGVSQSCSLLRVGEIFVLE